MKTILYTLANILGIFLVVYFAWDLPDKQYYGVLFGIYIYGFSLRKGWQF